MGVGIQVAVGEDDKPPDEGEQEPGEDERESENHQRPTPLRVHEGREDVLEISAPALSHVPLDYVTVSVLEYDALSYASRCVSCLAVSGEMNDNSFYSTLRICTFLF